MQFLLSTISPLADAKDNSVKNEHSRTTTNTNIQPQYITVDGVKINRNPILPVNPDAQNRIGATKIVKTTIKVIINNKSKAVKVVEKVGGKKAANAFNKAYIL